jgi:hypothetical protein
MGMPLKSTEFVVEVKPVKLIEHRLILQWTPDRSDAPRRSQASARLTDWRFVAKGRLRKCPNP